MTTTKDTAYLTFNEETEHSNEEDCKENKIQVPLISTFLKYSK